MKSFEVKFYDCPEDDKLLDVFCAYAENHECTCSVAAKVLIRIALENYLNYEVKPE